MPWHGLLSRQTPSTLKACCSRENLRRAATHHLKTPRPQPCAADRALAAQRARYCSAGDEADRAVVLPNTPQNAMVSLCVAHAGSSMCVSHVWARVDRVTPEVLVVRAQAHMAAALHKGTPRATQQPGRSRKHPHRGLGCTAASPAATAPACLGRATAQPVGSTTPLQRGALLRLPFCGITHAGRSDTADVTFPTLSRRHPPTTSSLQSLGHLSPKHKAPVYLHPGRPVHSQRCL